MRILIVSRGIPAENNPLSGIFEWDQAKALRDIGHEVVYAVLDMRSIRRKRPLGYSFERREGIDVYRYAIPLGRVGSPLLNAGTWFAFRIILKEILKRYGNIDVMHGHFGRVVGYALYKAKKNFGIPYIITEHDSILAKGRESKYTANVLKKIYDGAACRIAVSKSFAEILGKKYKNNFEYIPNIADFSAFGDVEKVDHGQFTFVSVGNLIERKAMDVTIKGFAELCKTNDDVKLILVGDGPQKDALKKLVDELHLTGRVEFAGRLDRHAIKEVFAKSDCFVLMSRSETFGVVYIEAMACGLPVIATRCGGPESFVNENNGILVDVDSIDQLVEAMGKMMKTKYDAKELRQFCADNFAPEVVANQITILMEKYGTNA